MNFSLQQTIRLGENQINKRNKRGGCQVDSKSQEWGMDIVGKKRPLHGLSSLLFGYLDIFLFCFGSGYSSVYLIYFHYYGVLLLVIVPIR